LAIFPKSEGYVSGNDEGRIQVNFFKEQGKTKNYAFRTQRNTEKKELYPIHDLCFHPNEQLVTGGMYMYICFLFLKGGDGSYTMWDLYQEDKCMIGDIRHPNNLAVVALACSPDGRYLAVANSYDWIKVG
jgi:WD40 repeat protein